MKFTHIISALAGCFLAAGICSADTAPPATTVIAADNGYRLVGKTAEEHLGFPLLMDAGHHVVHKRIGATVDGTTTKILYDGAEIDATLSDPGIVRLKFIDPPADIAYFSMDMTLPQGDSSVSSWKIDAASGSFPAVKPDKPFLFQGMAKHFTITTATALNTTITVPDFSFVQLQDDRQWNTPTFEWEFISPFDRNRGVYTVAIQDGLGGPIPAMPAAPAAAPAPAVIEVDRFGQPTLVDYPGKVHSDDELKADVATENSYYASLKPPTFDKYGGLPGSRQSLGLSQTGYFHVEKKSTRWIMVDPDGNAFFHLGVCSFEPLGDYTLVGGRRQIFEWLPAPNSEFKTAFRPGDNNTISFQLVNQIRKYGKPYDPQSYTATMIDRVRKWGFNSEGAFSGAGPAQTAANFPYALMIACHGYYGIPDIPGIEQTFDPFDPAVQAKYDSICAKFLPVHVDDPLVIGYFISNEPHHEEVQHVVPMLPGKYPAKRRLVQMLSDKYQTIDAFNKAWNMNAASFDELEDKKLVVATQAASDDIEAYVGLFFDAYYKLTHDTIRKYDTNHMIIGDRWQPGTANNQQLCSIAGKYLDIVSVNYYTYGLDMDYLNRIEHWSGDKPILLSEFYWSSSSDSGLPSGTKPVGSQLERGLAYRNYVEQAAATGYVVGAEWFTLNDCAYTGVFYSGYDGERDNDGLLSVLDRPWTAMLDEMMKTNYGIYDVELGKGKPYVYDDPRFTDTGGGHKIVNAARLTQSIAIDGGVGGWPKLPPELISGKRLVEGSSSAGLEAAYRVAWDDANLYLLVNITDPTPMMNTHVGDSIWSGDGVELFIGSDKLDQPGSLLFTDHQVLLSGGLVDGQPHCYFAHAAQQTPARMSVSANVDGKGYTLEAAIPWTALDIKPDFGKQLLFDLAIDDSSNGRGRSRQLMWNGSAKNSGDRTEWGRLQLTH